MSGKRKSSTTDEGGAEEENINVASADVPFRRGKKVPKNAKTKNTAVKYVYIFFSEFSSINLLQN